MNTLQAIFGPSKNKMSTYQGASTKTRMSGWSTPTTAINNVLNSDLVSLRDRSRDLVRQNPYASNALDTLVSNIVGTGIRPLLGWEDEKFSEQVRAVWEEWIEEADATDRLSFYGMQALACREAVESGDVFIRLRDRKPSDNMSVPLQLQMIESEQLDTSKSSMVPNARIRNGVEYDAIGKVIAYHFYREHPLDSLTAGLISVRVPANKVAHIFKSTRAGQQRGVPWLSSIIVKLHELDQYDDAELLKQKISAMHVGFVTRTATDEDDNPLPGATEVDGEPGVVDVSMEPATMQYLDAGEEVTFSSPAGLGDNYGEFMRTQLQAVSVGFGLLYEQVSGDLRNVSFSSIRTGILEFRRKVEATQGNMIVHQMCRPVFSAFMKKAMLSGAIKTPSDFNSNMNKYLTTKWIAQGFDWVDPLKDVQATIKEMRAGITSRASAAAKRGVDVVALDKDIKKERDRADSEGLVFESDAGQGKEAAKTPQPATTDAKLREETRKQNKKAEDNNAKRFVAHS